ncbi:protein of unknown function [Epibacterium ulvae]|uniref:T6SS immunity protein Tdi1 C-terminal domain-containing protein n=1 Tax=Epibacterium ulvae TaxID=1156985 RepID=A0A1G5PWF8_9RHOB|nr:T6SS immunity protein Tdi1 domain-containing protein [Epibacterium ulvae]SCZ53762.1 protein of unknown function [Epibacterium ulvae]
MNLIAEVNRCWSWTGLQAVSVEAMNSFGNLLICDAQGQYRRICPEELTCEIVASSAQALSELWSHEDFVLDWEMTDLVQLAQAHLGELSEGWVYTLIIPGMFGGAYEATNMHKVPLSELIEHSGAFALKAQEIPEGGQILFDVGH